jgi:hypothetical protein
VASSVGFTPESEMDGPEVEIDMDGDESTRIEGPGNSLSFSSLSSLSSGREVTETLSSIVGISARPKRLSRGEGDAMCCGWIFGEGLGVHREGGLRRDRTSSVPFVIPVRGGGLRRRDGWPGGGASSRSGAGGIGAEILRGGKGLKAGILEIPVGACRGGDEGGEASGFALADH